MNRQRHPRRHRHPRHSPKSHHKRRRNRRRPTLNSKRTRSPPPQKQSRHEQRNANAIPEVQLSTSNCNDQPPKQRPRKPPMIRRIFHNRRRRDHRSRRPRLLLSSHPNSHRPSTMLLSPITRHVRPNTQNTMSINPTHRFTIRTIRRRQSSRRRHYHRVSPTKSNRNNDRHRNTNRRTSRHSHIQDRTPPRHSQDRHPQRPTRHTFKRPAIPTAYTTPYLRPSQFHNPVRHALSCLRQYNVSQFCARHTRRRRTRRLLPRLPQQPIQRIHRNPIRHAPVNNHSPRATRHLILVIRRKHQQYSNQGRHPANSTRQHHPTHSRRGPTYTNNTRINSQMSAETINVNIRRSSIPFSPHRRPNRLLQIFNLTRSPNPRNQ